MRLRWGALVMAMALGLSGVACVDEDSSQSPAAQPRAGNWKTWVLSSASQIPVPAPPLAESPEGQGELAELQRLAGERDDRMRERAHFWGDYPATEPWTQLNLQLVREGVKNPPRASRGYALVAVAVHDAVV